MDALKIEIDKLSEQIDTMKSELKRLNKVRRKLTAALDLSKESPRQG